MKKTTFINVLSVLSNASDVVLENTYSAFSDEQIKALEELHFHFNELNMQSNKVRTMNKRFTAKSARFAVNKTVCNMLSESMFSEKERAFLISHNYTHIACDMSDIESVKQCFEALRNAHYESIAHALENAIDIEFKTSASKSRKERKKAK